MTDVLAPTELGRFLESARKTVNGEGISGREAARRARISESRWRQILREGRAPAVTVVAAALGVDADPATALDLAGIEASPGELQEFIESARTAPDKRRAQVTGLAEEIERIRLLPVPAKERIRVAQSVIKMFEDLAAEAQEPAENTRD